MINEDGTLSLYVYSTPDGFILALMDNPTDPGGPPVYGAVEPGHDGNYYQEICVSAVQKEGELEFTQGAEGWLKWLRDEAFPKGWAKVSDEFPFDPATLVVVELKGRLP